MPEVDDFAGHVLTYIVIVNQPDVETLNQKAGCCLVRSPCNWQSLFHDSDLKFATIVLKVFSFGASNTSSGTTTNPVPLGNFTIGKPGTVSEAWLCGIVWLNLVSHDIQ